MPRRARTLDLRDEASGLHRFAIPKLVAVLIEPENSPARRALLSNLTGPLKRDAPANAEHLRALGFAAPKGLQSGQMLLYLVQTYEQFGETSLSRVARMVSAAPLEWEQPTGDASAAWVEEGRPRHNADPKAIITWFKTRRHCAHFWAAMVFAAWWEPPDIYPTEDNLGRFVSLAEAISARAQRVRVPAGC